MVRLRYLDPADGQYKLLPVGGSPDEVHVGPSTPAQIMDLWMDTDEADPPGGGGGGTAPVRQTATLTTASLANNANETGSIGLANGYRLLRVQTDKAARVRLYTTTARRDTDVARSAGTDPTGDHGVMFDFVTTASILAADLSPAIDGFDGKTTPDGQIPYTVTNTSGATGTVTVTLTWLRTE